ncbi:hypothetical protein AALP_AA2G180900 [Arabis alpina]|uniref:RING-type domain-containing protein n=1 Tax=Arabis alpina TaxID=50452 RepID=A0A087HIB3_ARAAL|nr:hypothetical protein AALP_AA2G180900 [Arabis alpina]
MWEVQEDSPWIVLLITKLVVFCFSFCLDLDDDADEVPTLVGSSDDENGEKFYTALSSPVSDEKFYSALSSPSSGESDLQSDSSRGAVCGDSTTPSTPSSPTQSPPRTPSPPRAPPLFPLLLDHPSPPDTPPSPPPHPLVLPVYVAPPAVVENLPTREYSTAQNQEEDSTQCIICQFEYEEGETLRILDCDHEFHQECLDPWLTGFQGVCPLCRDTVDSDSSEEDSGDNDSTSSVSDDSPRTFFSFAVSLI